MIQDFSGESPESLVREAIARWRAGEPPNAQQFLESHPEIRERKSLAIDLIYEEYCLRQEQGETFVASTFCRRFPSYKQSLARMLDVHKFMAQGAADHAPAWPKPGDEFLGFKIVEQIGAGAVAKVYLAREVDVGGRLVVVKVSQFGRGEARLLGKLSHPGVVPIHSVRDDALSGMTCICMPFLGTATLVDVLDDAFTLGGPPASAQVVSRVAPGYLPAGVDPAAWPALDPFLRRATYEEGIVHLARQIVTALAKAHQGGITHRDIKPSNVLLSRDGRPMLLDFNLSTDEQAPADRIGGTLAYMAPERLEALVEGREETEPAADPRSDLYSVGAMLFELLTGQLPSRPPEVPGQRQPTPAQWLACRRAEPESARKLNSHVEPALDAILMRCLAPRPSDRFASADELLAGLEKLLAPRARLQRQLHKRRRAVVTALLVALAVLIGCAAWWYTRPPQAERLYQSGLTAYDRGDYKGARDYFTKSIDAGNDSVEAYFARGQANRQLKDYEQNLDFSEVQNDDDSGIVLFYLAFAAQEFGREDLAMPMLQAAIDAGWKVPSVANQLAIARVDLGIYEEALADFDRILATTPDDDRIRFNRTLAWAIYCANQTDKSIDRKAMDDAKFLVEKYPSDAEAKELADFVRRLASPRDAVSNRGGSPLGLSWRKTAPPTSPRFLDCIQSLKNEPRLK